jgi:anaerobic selenocysteine-containing dehydrogenase
VVDPRFTRSAAVADVYAPIRVGTDIAFLGGVINYLLMNNKIHHDYVKLHQCVFLINPDFKYDNGFFSGYDEAKRSYAKLHLAVCTRRQGRLRGGRCDAGGPNCVFQLMKKHYSRYTPEMVSKITGTPKDVPEDLRADRRAQRRPTRP